MKKQDKKNDKKWGDQTVSKGAIVKFIVRALIVVIIGLGLFFSGIAVGKADTARVNVEAAALVKQLKSQK